MLSKRDSGHEIACQFGSWLWWLTPIKIMNINLESVNNKAETTGVASGQAVKKVSRRGSRDRSSLHCGDWEYIWYVKVMVFFVKGDLIHMHFVGKMEQTLDLRWAWNMKFNGSVYIPGVSSKTYSMAVIISNREKHFS